jgi:hypothetical protein
MRIATTNRYYNGDFWKQVGRCTHICAPEYVYQRELFYDGTVAETETITVNTKRTTYPQHWQPAGVCSSNSFRSDKYELRRRLL